MTTDGYDSVADELLGEEMRRNRPDHPGCSNTQSAWGVSDDLAHVEKDGRPLREIWTPTKESGKKRPVIPKTS